MKRILNAKLDPNVVLEESTDEIPLKLRRDPIIEIKYEYNAYLSYLPQDVD